MGVYTQLGCTGWVSITVRPFSYQEGTVDGKKRCWAVAKASICFLDPGLSDIRGGLVELDNAALPPLFWLHSVTLLCLTTLLLMDMYIVSALFLLIAI